jgi:hypothetical protein
VNHLHRLLVAAAVAGVAAAGTALARPEPKGLADFLPATVEGRPPVETVGQPNDPYRAEGWYELEGEPDADGISSRRKLRVDIYWTVDPQHAREVHVRAEGQTKTVGGTEFKGFNVQGHLVERAFERWQSVAKTLLADRVVVEIVVAQPRDPDEPIRWMRELDFAGIERFARATGPALLGVLRPKRTKAHRPRRDLELVLDPHGDHGHGTEVLRLGPKADGGAP